MNGQQILAKRIKDLCMEKNMSFYSLSYQAAVPLTTIMHIIDCSTGNPGIFTIVRICRGFGITIKEFFDTKDFEGIEYELE